MSLDPQHLEVEQMLLPADAKLVGFVRCAMLIVLSDRLTRKLLATIVLLVLGRYFSLQGRCCCCDGSGN